MFCKKCGANIPDNVIVCPYCQFDFNTPMPQTLRTPVYRAGYSDSGSQLVSPEPVYQEPVFEEPVYEQPVSEQPQYQQPVYQQPPYQPSPYEQPAHQYIEPVPQVPQAVTPQQASESNSILIFGILGLAFAWNFSILGIIFSAITKSKSNEYLSCYGAHYGKAKVGRILANIGLPISIATTCFWVIYICYIIFFVAAVGFWYLS
ncbi:MAG: hypothetical protein IJJ15_05920 [Ruminococcus sp.]|nr:hypothetical protein [Ruminococcus sp.]